MPRKSSSAAAAQVSGTQNDQATQADVPPYVRVMIFQVFILGATLEYYDRETGKSDSKEPILRELVIRHGIQWDKGDFGVYSHCLVREIKGKYPSVSEEEIARSGVEKTVGNGVTRCSEDLMRNAKKLIVKLYDASCFTADKQLKSGLGTISEWNSNAKPLPSQRRI